MRPISAENFLYVSKFIVDIRHQSDLAVASKEKKTMHLSLLSLELLPVIKSRDVIQRFDRYNTRGVISVVQCLLATTMTNHLPTYHSDQQAFVNCSALHEISRRKHFSTEILEIPRLKNGSLNNLPIGNLTRQSVKREPRTASNTMYLLLVPFYCTRTLYTTRRTVWPDTGYGYFYRLYRILKNLPAVSYIRYPRTLFHRSHTHHLALQLYIFTSVFISLSRYLPVCRFRFTCEPLSHRNFLGFLLQ